MARAQKITSAATSVNMLPRLFKRVWEKGLWERGSLNLDIGGGKFETATDFLHSKGVHNFVYDPFNRSEEHNERVWDLLISYRFADTVTLSNVLNVIQFRRDRIKCLEVAAMALKEDGVLFITVYEGNRSGKGGRTTRGFQLNRPVKRYVSEAEDVFRDVDVMSGGIIVARDSKA